MERNDKMKVGIVMGSKSDYPVVERAEKVLTDFGVEFETRIISAHRTPVAAMEFASKAEENGIEVIIAAAGKAGASGRCPGGVYTDAGYRSAG